MPRLLCYKETLKVIVCVCGRGGGSFLLHINTNMPFYSKCAPPPSNAEHLCSAVIEAAVLKYVLILNAGSCSFQGFDAARIFFFLD